MRKFPKEFLWGTAMSANQMEGSWDVDKKGMSVADIRPYNPNIDRSKVVEDLKMTKDKFESLLNDKVSFFPKRWGIDFYNTYIEDIKLLNDLGVKVFRTSIAWTRIFPIGDEKKPNQKGLNFYRKMFEECKKYNMEILVTMSHLETPIGLIKKYGGWKNKEVIKLFVNYSTAIMEEFKDIVKYWMPFNEFNHMDFDNTNVFDDDKEFYQNSYQAFHNQFVANAKTIEVGKNINKEFQFGTMIGHTLTYPETCKPIDQLMNQQQLNLSVYFYYDVMSKGEYPWYIKNHFKMMGLNINMTDSELKIIKNNTVDYLGFSYYATGIVGSSESLEVTGNNVMITGVNPYLDKTEWGWQIDSEGLGFILRDLYSRYNKPLFVAENGVACEEKNDNLSIIEDDYRIDYLNKHFEQMADAIDEGIEVIGYTLWTPIDLVSFSSQEMSKRYGVVYVDQDDMGNGTKKRIHKKSFKWLAKYYKESIK